MLRTKVKSDKNTIVRDLPLRRILEELDLADRSYTKVGFPVEGNIKGGKKGVKKDQPNTISEVAQIAFYLEFGTRFIEGWPFITTSFEENLNKINSMVVKLYNKIIDGNMTAERALGLVGEFLTSKTKAKIIEIDTPPNKPATIKRKKGADNPLIDTAQMLNSVQHVEKMV